MATIEITEAGLKKLNEEARFKLWYGLVQVLEPDQIQALNRELSASFFYPPEKVQWLPKTDKAGP